MGYSLTEVDHSLEPLLAQLPAWGKRYRAQPRLDIRSRNRKPLNCSFGIGARAGY